MRILKMSKIEKRNGQIILIDNEEEIVIENLKFTSDGYLKIPQNSTGRTLVKYSKIENLNDGEFYELKDKVEKTFSGTSGKISQKSLIEYLSDEDRKIYDELMEKAKMAYEKAHEKVELTPIEKAELKVKKAMEQLRKLQEAIENAEAEG
jgi:hypothetical protein